MSPPRTMRTDERAPEGGSVTPPVLWLDDERALDAALVGAKAANLAAASGRGLPTVPGFVVTTSAGSGLLDPSVLAALQAAFEQLVGGAEQAVVVRSSSTAEDTATSSMAGQFTSVLGVRGWDGLVEAVGQVLASARHPRSGIAAPHPMGVIVQREVEARSGGVLFALDPVSGDRRHLVVEVVGGSPEALVSGRAIASHLVLGRRGRLVDQIPAGPDPLGGHVRRRLAGLARGVQRAFPEPQDIEWALDARDRLWLLQTRAITAAGLGVAAGPVLGPGPVAETFPDPLSRLEVDLWVDPLREGVIRALEVLGVTGRRRIERSPVVATVGGRAVADLDLLGARPPAHPWMGVLNPVPAARRLVASWRVGRLRAALPALAAGVLAQADDDLSGVGDLRGLDDAGLLTLLERATEELAALHGHEVLAGMLLRGPDGSGRSLASVALARLVAERAEGRPDAEIVARAPVVLALCPPTVGGAPVLPPTDPVSRVGEATGPELEALGPREGLRLRCRWFQALTGACARQLGERLAAAGVLSDPPDVGLLSVGELRTAVEDGRAPLDLEDRRAARAGPPLPPAFRLDSGGAPHALPCAGTASAGLGASAGRVEGEVVHEPEAARHVAERSRGRPILVIESLDPRLAAVLPVVAGIVSETGSALSHLAILAREAGVPAVVAVAGARRCYPPGTHLVVDGGTGEVRRVQEVGT